MNADSAIASCALSLKKCIKHPYQEFLSPGKHLVLQEWAKAFSQKSSSPIPPLHHLNAYLGSGTPIKGTLSPTNLVSRFFYSGSQNSHFIIAAALLVVQCQPQGETQHPVNEGIMHYFCFRGMKITLYMNRLT
jgi:hypothetical protein